MPREDPYADILGKMLDLEPCLRVCVEDDVVVTGELTRALGVSVVRTYARLGPARTLATS